MNDFIVDCHVESIRVEGWGCGWRRRDFFCAIGCRKEASTSGLKELQDAKVKQLDRDNLEILLRV